MYTSAWDTGHCRWGHSLSGKCTGTFFVF